MQFGLFDKGTKHSKDGQTPITTVEKFTYDRMGRLLTHTHQITGQAEETLAENVYDELGQLIQKKTGNNTAAPLQTVDYSYNIRGWLTGINDVSNLQNDLFGFQLHYDDPTGGTALYNGNISQTHWRTNNTDSSLKNYTYAYDPLNRITQAIGLSGSYDLNNVTYDKNGNILSLNRQGHLNEEATAFGVMDELTYSYDIGNKLLTVEDTADDTFGFKDDAVNTPDNSPDYTYDANGNMLSDTNKNITGISYNHLNLPTEITFNADPNQKINYFYSADGIKQQKVVTDSGVTTTTAYTGGTVYENGSLKFINQAEGYIEPDGVGGYDYVYQYKDHLGNIRLSYSDSNGDGVVAISELIEESNYYPFGLRHRGYNNVVNGTENKFLTYNGVEFEESLDLNMYEMDWRSFDPAIARWTSIDPVTHYNLSPYNGMDNNPIIGSDPSGADVIEIEGGYKFTGQDAIDAFKILQGNTGNSGSDNSSDETEDETSETESDSTGAANTTSNSTSTTSSSQDPCPKCPDKEKRKLAIMMAKHQGGNAQDYYDALANPDFVDDRIESNVFWLLNIFTLTTGAPLLKSLFSKKAIAITFGKNANQIFHTFRHIEAAGLSKEVVKKAVRKSVKQSASLIKTGKSFNKTITVGGKQIRYSAYKLPSGEINVGRIVIPK